MSKTDKIRLIDEWEYSPREIAENGFIKNTRGKNASYEYVLWLINQGMLKARDIRKGKPNRSPGNFKHRKYFVVKGWTIRRFNQRNRSYPSKPGK